MLLNDGLAVLDPMVCAIDVLGSTPALDFVNCIAKQPKFVCVKSF